MCFRRARTVYSFANSGYWRLYADPGTGSCSPVKRLKLVEAFEYSEQVLRSVRHASVEYWVRRVFPRTSMVAFFLRVVQHPSNLIDRAKICFTIHTRWMGSCADSSDFSSRRSHSPSGQGVCRFSPPRSGGLLATSHAWLAKTRFDLRFPSQLAVTGRSKPAQPPAAAYSAFISAICTFCWARRLRMSRTSFHTLFARQAHSHSSFTFFRPRSRNCRRPRTCLM